jgi:probable addiction module antidote protein
MRKLGSDPAFSHEAIALFMAEAFQTNDVSYIAHALGVVARAKGMAQIAQQTGLSREQLYRSFSENGNPTLKTTLAVMQALGLGLHAQVLHPHGSVHVL